MSNSRLTLGVLDQSPIPDGGSPGDALRNSLDLAKLTEELGYSRYWVAEHHGTPGLACASPEVLIGPLAAATSHIRVGSGGVMLPHYSPLKVAENFTMLSELYPDRIDLGLGRAAGTSSNVAVALQRDRRQRPPDDFPEQLDELLQYFKNTASASGPLSRLHAAELKRNPPPRPWLLGSSPQSAIWAAERGLPYVFADFINAEGAAAAHYYREHFRPSSYLDKPYVITAVWAFAADTDEEAVRLSFSLRMLMTLLFRGRLIAVPPVERAEQFLREEGVPLDLLPAGRRIITGGPTQIRPRLEAVAKEYAADELLLINIVYDHAARRHSYELIAEAFGLKGAKATQPAGSTLSR